MKLALILLIVIAVISGLSTFVIQGESNEYYIENYPLLGSLFIKIGFTNFFRSMFFIALMGLFFINLSMCTIKRLYKEITGAIKLRLGPDFIHIGLLILIVGGSINVLLEQEASVMLSIGDEISVGDYIVTLNDFEFLKYENGAPKDWISNLTIKKTDGEIVRDNFEIEVNKPVRFSGFSIFQSRYNVINFAQLESEDKQIHIVKSGYMFDSRGKRYILDDVEPGKSALFQVVDEENHTDYYRYNIGSILGGFKVLDTSRELSSGLLIKREPAYIMNYIALVLMLAGFLIAYIQKIGVKEK